MKHLRVLLVTSHAFLPQFIGGAEVAAHNLAIQLKRRGHTVAILCGIRGGDLVWLRHGLQRRFVPTRLSVDHKMGYPVYRDWDPPGKLEVLTKQFRPDVLIVEGGSSIAAFSRTKLRRPSLVMVHDVEFAGKTEHFLHFRPCVFVANSDFTARCLKQSFDIDAVVMRPIVDESACRVAAKGRKVVMVNPCAVKGVGITLALAAARPSIPFVLQESWSFKTREREVLLLEAARLRNVEVRPPNSDPKTFLREARILLVPSMWNEAWGRVVTEAHVSGIPVLASSAGALPESVGPGGVLVDRHAPLQDWITALDRIWNDDAHWEQMSAAASRYSKRPEVSPVVQIRRFEELLLQLTRDYASCP